MTKIPANHTMPPPPELTLEEALKRLRTVDWMLELMDVRLEDDSMAPMPYEVSVTEMRDIRRTVRGEGIFTRVGRESRAIASEELGK